MQRELDARGVTAERTVAAGHSEGSVVVSRLAVSDRASDLDGIILLSGPSVGILEIMPLAATSVSASDITGTRIGVSSPNLHVAFCAPQS